MTHTIHLVIGVLSFAMILGFWSAAIGTSLLGSRDAVPLFALSCLGRCLRRCHSL